MSVVFSIIVVANDASESSLTAFAQLENEHVELLICTSDAGAFDDSLLRAAIEQCSGEYTLILDNHNVSVSEEWLCQLSSHVNANQLIGAQGCASLSAVGIERLQSTSVSELVIAAPIQHNAATGQAAKMAVALTGNFLFSGTDFLRSHAFSLSDFLSVGSEAGSFISRYSLRMKLHNDTTLLNVDGQISSGDSQQSIEPFLNGYEGLFPITGKGVCCWQKNAKALREYDEGIAASITDGLFVGADLQFKQKQKGRIVVTGKSNDVILSDTQVRIEELPDNETIILFGIGAGELVEALLRKTSSEVLIVEPEAKLINYLWMRYDWSEHIENGRLRYVPIANEHAILHSISTMQTGRFLQRVFGANARPTQVIRSGSYHLYPDFYKTLEVSLNWFLRLNRIAKTWIGKEKLVYDVTIVSPRCAIFVDLAECLHRLGVRTRILNVPDGANQLTEDGIIQLLASLNVDASNLIVYRNRSFIESEDVTLAAGLEDRIPGAQLSWWWDVPNVSSFIDMQLTEHNRPAIAFASEMLPTLPQGSAWLPPAAQHQFCTGELKNPCRESEMIPGVCFVGQSRIAHLRTHLKVLSEVLPLIGGPVFNELQGLFERFENYNQLYQQITQIAGSIDSELDVHSVKMPAQVYYLKYILRMAESAAFRVASIEELVRAKVPLQVYGDDEWVKSGVVPSDEFRGVIERRNLRALYERSQLNLNLNFMQVSSTVNPKVLDIAACGGRVLTDSRPELGVLYPDPAIRPHCFEGIDELPDIVSSLLFSQHETLSASKGELDSRLQAIAERTRSHHSMENRARWLIEHFSLL